MRKMLAVARKEFRQIWRDTRTLMTLLFVPAFFLVLYGYALNFDIRHVGLGVDDRDRSTESRALVAAFVNSGYFDLVAMVDDAETTRLMDTNAVRAVLVIPPGLGRAVGTARPIAVQVLLNGDNANTATTVMGYAATIIRSESARHQQAASPAAPIAPAPLVSAEPRVWYNPSLRSTLFLVPGLIAYIAMITAVVSTALSIVREKERGTMEQVRMAPLDAASFVVGKTVPYFVVSLLSALAIILVSMALFGMPMRGSWLLLLALSLFLVGALGLGLLISRVADTQQVAFQAALLVSFLPTLMLSGFIFPIASMPRFLQLVTYAVPARYFLIALRGSVWLLFGLTLIYLLTTLGLGLFVSTISSTQQQAMMTTTFFLLTPMIYLSGFIFPIENMPAVIQPFTYLIPLRYFLVILRSIFLKGVGLETLWPQALALTAWGVAILALAIARSAKRAA